MFVSWTIFLRGEGIREIRTGEATYLRSRVSSRAHLEFLRTPRHVLMIKSKLGERTGSSDENCAARNRWITFDSNEIGRFCRFVGFYFYIS
jgi:hypothetical protein